MTSDSPKKANKTAASSEVPSEPIEWTSENEVALFYAMKGRRPVGIDRNFQMFFISDSFNQRVNREVDSKHIWDHLAELYDTEALNENNSPPSAVMENIEFKLPEEFDSLKEAKVGDEEVEEDQEEDEEEEEDQEDNDEEEEDEDNEDDAEEDGEEDADSDDQEDEDETPKVPKNKSTPKVGAKTKNVRKVDDTPKSQIKKRAAKSDAKLRDTPANSAKKRRGAKE